MTPIRYLLARRFAACLLVLCAAAPCFASRIVADETGHNVTLPDHVRRIVCLTPSVADTVYAVGAGEQVVGVSDYTMYPPQARQKPSIGGVVRPSLERIAVLHPDLVIGIAPFNDSESIRGIQRMGIPVFLVNNYGLEGLYKAVASIGRALARDAEASALIAKLQARERKVRAEAQSGSHPSVFFAISLDPCITAGRGAFLTELLTAAGARSVTADIAQEWANINIEAIVPKKPDFVLVVKGSPFGLKEMRERPGWRSFDAVRAGRVIRVDDRLQYPSPVAIDALEELARQLRSAETR